MTNQLLCYLAANQQPDINMYHKVSMLLLLAASVAFMSCSTEQPSNNKQQPDLNASSGTDTQPTRMPEALPFEDFIAGFGEYGVYPYHLDSLDTTALQPIAQATAKRYIPAAADAYYYGPAKLVNDSFYLAVVHYQRLDTGRKYSDSLSTPLVKGSHLLSWNLLGDTLAFVPNVFYEEHGLDESGEHFYKHSYLQINKYLTLQTAHCQGTHDGEHADSVLLHAPDHQDILHYTVLADGTIRQDYEYFVNSWRMDGIMRDRKRIYRQLKPFKGLVFKQVQGEVDALQRFPEQCGTVSRYALMVEHEQLDSGFFAQADSSHFPLLVHETPQDTTHYTITGIWMDLYEEHPVLLVRSIGEKKEYARGVFYFEMGKEEYLFPLRTHNYEYYSLEDPRHELGANHYYVNQMGITKLPAASDCEPAKQGI